MVTQIEQYWTVEQVAERIQCSAVSVRRWLAHGKIEKTKAGSRTLISETALQTFLRPRPSSI